jgi:hypothetical protein
MKSVVGRFRLFSNFERNTALPHQAEIGFSLSEHAESLLDLAFQSDVRVPKLPKRTKQSCPVSAQGSGFSPRCSYERDANTHDAGNAKLLPGAHCVLLAGHRKA